MYTHAKQKKNSKIIQVGPSYFLRKLSLEAKHPLHMDAKVWFCKLIVYFLPPVLKQPLLPKSINLYNVVEYSYLDW